MTLLPTLFSCLLKKQPVSVQMSAESTDHFNFVVTRSFLITFLKLSVAFFSHWRLEAHIPLHCHILVGTFDV